SQVKTHLRSFEYTAGLYEAYMHTRHVKVQNIPQPSASQQVPKGTCWSLQAVRNSADDPIENKSSSYDYNGCILSEVK
ncbi:unnamed protein product, partial [Allacma fusca]